VGARRFSAAVGMSAGERGEVDAVVACPVGAVAEYTFVVEPGLDCGTHVACPQPGDAVCPNCGQLTFLTEVGQLVRVASATR
jgi:hypothetical protein